MAESIQVVHRATRHATARFREVLCEVLGNHPQCPPVAAELEMEWLS